MLVRSEYVECVMNPSELHRGLPDELAGHVSLPQCGADERISSTTRRRLAVPKAVVVEVGRLEPVRVPDVLQRMIRVSE